MKFIRVFFLVMIVSLIFGGISPPADAQTSKFTQNAYETTESGVKYVDFVGTIKAGDSLWSAGFKLGKYQRIVSVSKVMSQANDSVKIKIERWQLPLANTWVRYKTIAASDSTQAANTAMDTLYLQNQKLLIIGNAGTGLNAAFKIRYEMNPP